jgi:hypothetical protein
MKNLLKIAAFLAALALMGWVGLYLHWHFRIVGAVQTLAKQPPIIVGDAGFSSSGEANEILLSGGCRSLSYLVGALEHANNSQLLCDMYLKILTMSLPADLKAQVPTLEENRITLADNAEMKRRKAEALRTWWQANESRIHQGWKVWSSKCADP